MVVLQTTSLKPVQTPSIPQGGNQMRRDQDRDLNYKGGFYANKWHDVSHTIVQIGIYGNRAVPWVRKTSAQWSTCTGSSHLNQPYKNQPLKVALMLLQYQFYKVWYIWLHLLDSGGAISLMHRNCRGKKNSLTWTLLRPALSFVFALSVFLAVFLTNTINLKDTYSPCKTEWLISLKKHPSSAYWTHMKANYCHFETDICAQFLLTCLIFSTQ